VKDQVPISTAGVRARNPYAPPTARSLELLNSAQAWDRVGLLVPAFGTACVVAVGLVVVGVINSGLEIGISRGMFVGVFVAFWFAVALAFVVGLVFRYLARYWGLGQAWIAVIVGTVVGGMSALATDSAMRSIPELSPVKVPTIAYIQFGVIGAAAGLVFWLLARRRLRINSSPVHARGDQSA
jgi:hypothetical protein